MKKTLIFMAIAASVSGMAYAAKPAINGPFSFVPKLESALPGSEDTCAPFALPEGFSQTIVIEETGVCGAQTLDVIPGQSDLTDMNTVNETGNHVGRFLYRTHENSGATGGISVIDLDTGDTASYFADDFGISPGFSRLDGLEWTPWGTVLMAEENGSGGRMFECNANGLQLECFDRPMVGRMSHEGIAADGDGTVYVADELNGGSIYKFVPEQYGDLTSGVLYGLNITDEGDDGISGTGAGEWVALIPGQNGVITDPAVNARAAADEAGLTDYYRPEDAELIGSNLYFATTTDKRVLQIPVNSPTPQVTEFVGVNIGNINNGSVVPAYGLTSPDNLASDAAGNLYIVEDNSSKSDIWVAGKDKDGDGSADSVELFATLTTLGAEGTGIYFARTMPKAMFVNVQHAANGNDMTVMIIKDKK